MARRTPNQRLLATFLGPVALVTLAYGLLVAGRPLPWLVAMVLLTFGCLAWRAVRALERIADAQARAAADGSSRTDPVPGATESAQGTRITILNCGSRVRGSSGMG